MIKTLDYNKCQAIILPQFNCQCGKSYKTLSPLYNHIKSQHQGDFQNYKLDRGVPEGRYWKIDKYEKKFLERLFAKEINSAQQLEQEDIRIKFEQIVKKIDDIVKEHQLDNIRNDLLKLNIKLQPIWTNIEQEKIIDVMKKYFYSYLFTRQIINNLPFELKDDSIVNELNDFLKDTQNVSNINCSPIKDLSQVVENRHQDSVQKKVIQQ